MIIFVTSQRDVNLTFTLDVEAGNVCGSCPLDPKALGWNRRASIFRNTGLHSAPREAYDTIEYLKVAIHNELGVMPNRQHLTFRGVQLESCKTLADYNIQNRSTIRVVLQQSGSVQARASRSQRSLCDPILHSFHPVIQAPIEFNALDAEVYEDCLLRHALTMAVDARKAADLVVFSACAALAACRGRCAAAERSAAAARERSAAAARERSRSR